ncbi:MAG: glycosyltransferase family 87 protein [Blastocatellales bacterium]
MTFSPGFKRFLLILIPLYGLIGVKPIIQSFAPSAVYRKDFISPYLMAKAIQSDVNPYLPLPELAARWLPDLPHGIFPHPTPHTPALGLLSLPLAPLDYRTAALIWLLCQVGCLVACVALLQRWWGAPPRAGLTVGAACMILNWPPVVEDLWLGQINLLLLVLLLLAWLALREGKEILGGAMLGSLLALKLMAWPLLIFLALRRRWRGVAMAGAVMIATHLAAIAALGFGCVRDYYLKVGPLATSIYRAYDANLSAWAFGWRLFANVNSPISTGIVAPGLARWSMYAAPLAVLMLGLWLALRAKQFDTAFGALVCASLLVNPVAWTHYLVMGAIPMAIVARRLWAAGFPKKLSLVAVALSIPTFSYLYIARLFSTPEMTKQDMVFHPVVGLLSLIIGLVTLGWMWLVWLTERLESNQSASLKGASVKRGKESGELSATVA